MAQIFFKFAKFYVVFFIVFYSLWIGDLRIQGAEYCTYYESL